MIPRSANVNERFSTKESYATNYTQISEFGISQNFYTKTSLLSADNRIIFGLFQYIRGKNEEILVNKLFNLRERMRYIIEIESSLNRNVNRHIFLHAPI